MSTPGDSRYLVPQRDVDTVAVRKPSLKKEGDGGEEEEG
jgi:hypothetical protein